MRQNNYCSMILGGVFLIPLGCYLTWKNEANQVCSTGAFQVASGQTHEIGETCSINKEHDDLFLHLTCPVDQESLVTTESSTGISAKGAYKLTFLTEQYGYVQNYQTQNKCNSVLDANGELRDVCSDETERCSCFDLQWTTTPVSSTTFSSAKWCNSCNHNQNLTPPKDEEWGNTPVTKIGSFIFYADHVPLGDGTLKIDKAEIPAIKNKPLLSPPKSPTTINTNSFKIVESSFCGEGETVTCYYSTSMREYDDDHAGHYLYDDSDSKDTDVAHLGDLRMKVQAFGSRQISALGKEVQTGKSTATIKPASFGGSSVPPCQPRSLFYLTDGKYSADELYENLKANLDAQTVIFRILTMLVVAFGFHLSFSPLKHSVQALPVIGSCCAPLVEYIMHVFTLLATLILWAVVFAIAWIFYRPFFGALMLFIVVLVCFGIVFLLKKDSFGELPSSDEGVIEMLEAVQLIRKWSS